MKLVIFGLTISSSWGNGHATNLRGLLRQLIARGHEVTFFERDVPYYAVHRDLPELPGGKLQLYSTWTDAAPIAAREVADADVAMVTSYCPDGIAASELIWNSSALRVFYDMDTPVTLSRFRRGEPLTYISARGLSDFDLALSFTGGGALAALRDELGAREVAPLYGSVDPQLHHPVAPDENYRCALSYLGTYAADRQAGVDAFFIQPAINMPAARFLLAGAQYPPDFAWTENIHFVPHLAPREHAAFYCSSRLTLNVTRAAMREMGWCPSGRLFEAASCRAPLISDEWEGIDEFFAPGEEIIIARTTEDVIGALQRGDAELERIARAARERTLAENTAAVRATQLEAILEGRAPSCAGRSKTRRSASLQPA